MKVIILLLLPLTTLAQDIRLTTGRPTLTSPTGHVMDISMGVNQDGVSYHMVERKDLKPHHDFISISNFYEFDTLACRVSVVQGDDIKVISGYVVRRWEYKHQYDNGKIINPKYYLLRIMPYRFLSMQKELLNNTYPETPWYKIRYQQ